MQMTARQKQGPLTLERSTGEPARVNRNLFLFVYFFAFFTLYLGLIKDFSLNGVVQELKFIYLIYGAVMFLANGKKRYNKATTALFLVWALYIIVFATVFRNERVGRLIRDHFIMMSIYFGMLLVTYAEVRRNRCFYEFVAVSYFSIFCFLLVISLMNTSQIVWNPLYVVKAVVLDLRVRSNFGISGSSNYVGAFGFVGLILSFIYFNRFATLKQLLSDKCGFFILLSDCYLFLIFGSSSSRSPVASLLVFAFLFLVQKFYKKWKRIVPIVIILVVLVFTMLVIFGFFDYVWTNSNRTHTVRVNQTAFEYVDRFYIGMGFVQNNAFNSASGYPWGVYTSSIDMYYVYLFYTTGLIGTIWMGGILLAMLLLILKRRKHPQFDMIFSMYASLLFYAYWESMILTYRFWPFLVLFCIILLFIDGSVNDEKAERPVKVTERRFLQGDKHKI